MPLNTSTKRRSSVGILAPWLPAPPSPTDSAGVIDQADRAHSAHAYSGILAVPFGLSAVLQGASLTPAVSVLLLGKAPPPRVRPWRFVRSAT